MTTVERRKSIIRALNVRRYEKIDNLAFEFYVSRRTIINDIMLLSTEYPIYTTKGRGGGVHVVEGSKIFVFDKLNAEEFALLQKLSLRLTVKDLIIINGRDFIRHH